jgi:hypothetical protein
MLSPHTTPATLKVKLLSCGKRVLVVTCVLVIVNVTVVSQSMGANFSDTWATSYDIDDYNKGISIHGCGITDGSYSSYSHNYYMTVTTRSPNGRVTSAYASGGPYVRGDTSISFDPNDLGNHTTTHTTSGYCPGSNSNHVLGGGGSGINLGLHFSSYQNVGIENGRCLYSLNCAWGTTATCGVSGWSGLPIGTTCKPFFECGDVTVNGVCSIYRAVCVDRTEPALCD